MSDTIRQLLLSAMSADFEAFQDVLQACPPEKWSESPRPGHSVAWHALHIMDWTRCVIQPGLMGVNPALTYGYLGFEKEAWAQAVTGPTQATEHDDSATISTALQSVLQEALEAVRTAPAERLTEHAMFSAVKKPRPVLESLLYHVRHTAYHRGQARQVINQVNALAINLANPRTFHYSGQGKRVNIEGGLSAADIIAEGRGR